MPFLRLLIPFAGVALPWACRASGAADLSSSRGTAVNSGGRDSSAGSYSEPGAPHPSRAPGSSPSLTHSAAPCGVAGRANDPTDRQPHDTLATPAVGRTPTITPAEWFDFVPAKQLARADRLNAEETDG